MGIWKGIGNAAKMIGGSLAKWAAGPIGSIAIDAGKTIWQNRMNRKNQKEQNQYNTPTAQMERYRAAGLNPNLIYGQGTPGNQNQPVETSVPQADYSAAKSKAYALEQAKNESRASRHNDQIAEYKADQMYQDTKLKQMKGIGEQWNNFLKEVQSPYARDLARYNSEIQRVKLSNSIADGNIKIATLTNMALDKVIKEQIGKREMHWNDLRRLGIEPTKDNLFFRSGATLFQDQIKKVEKYFRK